MTDNKNQPITDAMAENITKVEELAYELLINQVMTRDISTVSPADMMEFVADLFREKRISGAPVLRDGTLVGILSIEDLIRCLRAVDLSSPVEKYMSARLITVNEFDPVIEALKTFVHNRVGRLPVLDGDKKLVGIITKGDITRGLLKKLTNEFQHEEIRVYRASHLFEDINSTRTSLVLRYNIKPRDFIHGGTASSYIKRALMRLGASPQIARRCGIAIYEAEMNLIIHSRNGGVIRVEIEPHQITMETIDDGPGIQDVDLAMKPGYSTATEQVREMGFGAGMGLANMSRCVDQLKIDSSTERGTRLKMKIYLKEQESFGDIRGNHTEGTP
jgi:CBS domain-containing protein/anti-sigma regulatory factor (Ser/Thr protein kinase)